MREQEEKTAKYQIPVQQDSSAAATAVVRVIWGALCVGQDRPELVQRLLVARGDVDAQMPLPVALANTTTEADKSSAPGTYPLVYISALRGLSGTFQALLACGARKTWLEPNMGWTLLHACASGGCAANLQLVLDIYDVDVRDSDNDTPLHVAAFAGHVAAAELLLERRADPCAVDADGCTPLHCACVRGAWSLVRQLLVAGANAAAGITDSRGGTALAYAVRSHADGVELGIVALLEACAPVCDLSLELAAKQLDSQPKCNRCVAVHDVLSRARNAKDAKDATLRAEAERAAAEAAEALLAEEMGAKDSLGKKSRKRNRKKVARHNLGMCCIENTECCIQSNPQEPAEDVTAPTKGSASASTMSVDLGCDLMLSDNDCSLGSPSPSEYTDPVVSAARAIVAACIIRALTTIGPSTKLRSHESNVSELISLTDVNGELPKLLLPSETEQDEFASLGMHSVPRPREQLDGFTEALAACEGTRKGCVPSELQARFAFSEIVDVARMSERSVEIDTRYVAARALVATTVLRVLAKVHPPNQIKKDHQNASEPSRAFTCKKQPRPSAACRRANGEMLDTSVNHTEKRRQKRLRQKERRLPVLDVKRITERQMPSESWATLPQEANGLEYLPTSDRQTPLHQIHPKKLRAEAMEFYPQGRLLPAAINSVVWSYDPAMSCSSDVEGDDTVAESAWDDDGLYWTNTRFGACDCAGIVENVDPIPDFVRNIARNISNPSSFNLARLVIRMVLRQVLENSCCLKAYPEELCQQTTRLSVGSVCSSAILRADAPEFYPPYSLFGVSQFNNYLASPAHWLHQPPCEKLMMEDDSLYRQSAEPRDKCVRRSGTYHLSVDSYGESLCPLNPEITPESSTRLLSRRR